MTPLTDAQRREMLDPLLDSGWKMVEGRDAIRKTFKFKDFSAAFGWMTAIAIVADKADHHPEWSNIYNRVMVLLTTHDAKGLTERDVKLAQAMDARAG